MFDSELCHEQYGYCIQHTGLGNDFINFMFVLPFHKWLLRLKSLVKNGVKDQINVKSWVTKFVPNILAEVLYNFVD